MGGATDNDNKENEVSFVSDTSFHKMRRLSVDVVRCHHHSISSQNNNTTDLSITSSMLAAHDSNDKSLV